MSEFITVIAISSLVPALYAAYGEVQDRIRSARLTRELSRAFAK